MSKKHPRKLEGIPEGTPVKLTIRGKLETVGRGCKCSPREPEWVINGWYIGDDFEDDYKLEVDDEDR